MKKYGVWRPNWKIPTAYLNQEHYLREIITDEDHWRIEGEKQNRKSFTKRKETGYDPSEVIGNG